MKPITPKAMIKLLKDEGFEHQRTKGDHEFYFNPENGRTTVVPISRDRLGIGLQLKILKQAGLR